MYIKVLALVVCLSFYGTCGARTIPIIDNGKVNNDALGIWYSSQDGWLLDITLAGIQRYQYSDSYCYPSLHNGPTFMGSIEYSLFSRSSKDNARFEYLLGDGFANFKRLERLPSYCKKIIEYENIDIFEMVVSMFSEFYPLLVQRAPNWPIIVSAQRAKMSESSTDQDLYSSLTVLIKSLSDPHTKLYTNLPKEKQRFQAGLGSTLKLIHQQNREQQWLLALVTQLFDEVLDEGAEHTANDRIIWGKINNDIGYIQLFTMGGFTDTNPVGSQSWADAEVEYFDKLMRMIMKNLSGTKAIVIDLSNNRGGYDVIARRLSGFFSDTSFAAYEVKNEINGPVLRTYEVFPASKETYQKPVYLLTSNVTVSGGEIATLALKEIPSVIHVGEQTRGSFSTPLAKPLPNGWYLELSNEIFVDMNSETHEGKGIEPDIRLQVYDSENLVRSHKEALKALEDIIRRDLAN